MWTLPTLLELTFRQYPVIHINYIISQYITLHYNHTFDTVLRQKGNLEHKNELIQQCCHVSTLAWTANALLYDDGRKRENSSAWKDRIIVASTCRRSVEFGCYVTWLWMANCVSTMTKMLPLYNFTIPCHGRRAWKTSSRFWLVESILFGGHASLRLHLLFSLKANLFN